ncbi:hypothetical protein [Methylobacterium sp. J-070]|uniref:hypothetical protein n=1 Tax=Methylobacterium sp. J-070 TaxID=2836650 RepID=UPI001FBC127A|nr:hypothetical protein [Methylobacterium sp. J-070]MCJ2054151.1 hypothetical protein [Methylobacterium sp. J-070]
MKGLGRSTVTNGNRLGVGLDGRTVWGRRMKDLIELHVADLGGHDVISEAERSLIRRAATIATELERMETQFAAAGEADPQTLDLYARSAGTLKRILEGLGMRRRPRDVTPDLTTYIEGRAA